MSPERLEAINTAIGKSPFTPWVFDDVLDYLDGRLTFIGHLQAHNTELVLENRALRSDLAFAHQLVEELNARMGALKPLHVALESRISNAMGALKLGDSLTKDKR